MSLGPWLAARDGVPAPAGSSPPRASAAAAATVGSAFAGCRNRGLTVIVESALPAESPLPLPSRGGRRGGPSLSGGHAGTMRARAGRPPPLVMLAITSLRFSGANAVLCRLPMTVGANKETVNDPSRQRLSALRPCH